jgi:hypothetical protein
LSREKKPSEPIKVTDKRIFTPDGDIREEFKANVTPVDPQEKLAPAPPPEPEKPKAEEEPHDKKKTVKDKGANPETPFARFVESLILQAYMSLGMLRNPYQQVPVDPQAARELIDIITMLSEKTAGNLTAEEDDFLKTHLGQLKLAYVQRSKTI